MAVNVNHFTIYFQCVLWYNFYLGRGMVPGQDADDRLKAEVIVEERRRTNKETGKSSAPQQGVRQRAVQGKKK